MKRHILPIITSVVALIATAITAKAGVADIAVEEDVAVATPTEFSFSDIQITLPEPTVPSRHEWITPYVLPYSRKTTGGENWGRLWANTAVLAGAFGGTLAVLECLPEEATAWNRAALQRVPPFTRWYRHIFKSGPEWDHDNAIFNYILHPYAGAAYFMAARSCGFSFWRSMLYSACVSTIGWEFGVEACMERPSYQDLVITPVVGSLLGELCYKGKRCIVNNGDELLGSWFLGRMACFFLDPVNEVIDLFRGNPAHAVAKQRRVSGTMMPTLNGFQVSITF